MNPQVLAWGGARAWVAGAAARLAHLPKARAAWPVLALKNLRLSRAVAVVSSDGASARALHAAAHSTVMCTVMHLP